MNYFFFLLRCILLFFFFLSLPSYLCILFFLSVKPSIYLSLSHCFCVNLTRLFICLTVSVYLSLCIYLYSYIYRSINYLSITVSSLPISIFPSRHQSINAINIFIYITFPIYSSTCNNLSKKYIHLSIYLY